MQICEIVATAATIETEFMTRLAVVTGGTRGIGAAVSIELKKRGYAVAATYAGNDERANAFSQDTGIAVFKFDVSDFDACKAGVAKITEQLGQEVDVLVNNAGITRDGTMHRMTPENWKAVLDTNLGGCYNMCATVIDGMRERSFGLKKIISRIPVGRLGKAEDIARSVAFLVADDADFITGSTLSVNGGQHMY